ncbi:hypothetical protein D3C76_649900 [compost metagenome]
MSGWISTYFNQLPPEGVVVETQDSGGNRQLLKRQGNLWWHPDGSMYVYYVPKFWRYVGAR